MPVKDALGRDLQLDYSNDIAQLRRQIDASRERRQRWGERVALQRLTLEQVTHIHGYEEEVRRALSWLGELYAVLLRCHSHVGCNIHEIQLQKDELQGFEETGRVSFGRERARKRTRNLASQFGLIDRAPFPLLPFSSPCRAFTTTAVSCWRHRRRCDSVASWSSRSRNSFNCSCNAPGTAYNRLRRSK